MKFLVIFFSATFLCVSGAFSAVSDWHEEKSKGASVRLEASIYTVNQNESKTNKIAAALHFKIADGWKMYGNDSDSMGMPPVLDFTGSTNYLNHQIFWPKAEIVEEKIGDELFQYSVYHDEVVIPFIVDLKEGDKLTDLLLRLEYGLCKDVCIPVSESFSLSVGSEVDRTILQQIRQFLPNEITAKMGAVTDDLVVDGIQKNQEEGNSEAKDTPFSLVLMLLIAFVGGMILNVMPCVLPVLSIKLLSVIKALDHHDSGDSDFAKLGRIRLAFLSTILGILFCFFVFAIFTSAIRIAGNSFGWGLQFQNPYFLIFLIVILTFFICNLFGVFEFSFDQFLSALLNKKISEIDQKNLGKKSVKKSIFIPNFLSGILAVLLATPCSAPFLGSAISFALAKGVFTIFLIFLGIGFGFASPYFFLLIVPKSVNLLPKSGRWMLQLKQLMASFLIATVAWLVYILSDNLGFIPATLIAAGSITILLCLRVKSHLLRYVGIVVTVVVMFVLPEVWRGHEIQDRAKEVGFYDSIWYKFDEMEIARQVAQGKVVVIDVTADWCITCKFNKIRVFHDAKIMKALDGEGVYAMRADITKPNIAVMAFMSKHNRFAIPFNVVYGPNARSGLLTSEFLSKKELLSMIEKAK